MFRRLMLAALALTAFLALESCGVSRVAAPQPIIVTHAPAPDPGPGGDRTDAGLNQNDGSR